MTSSKWSPRPSGTSGRCPTPSYTPSQCDSRAPATSPSDASRTADAASSTRSPTAAERPCGTGWAVLTPELYMLRDLALLKLFFGADPRELAEVQLETHRQRLTEYETLQAPC